MDRPWQTPLKSPAQRCETTVHDRDSGRVTHRHCRRGRVGAPAEPKDSKLASCTSVGITVSSGRGPRVFAAILAAGALAMGYVQAAPAKRGAAGRSCGTQTYRSGGSATTLRIRVLKGKVKCRIARKVFRDLSAGKGARHEKPGQGMAGVSVTVDGWTCGYFAGGDACDRGPKKHPTAEIQEIDADIPGS